MLKERPVIARLIRFFREQGGLVAILLSAFALRGWLLVEFSHPLLIHEQDAASFIANARDLLNARPFQDTFRPPFFSLIIALFSLLPLNMESAARVASITMDSLVIIPLYGIAKLFLPRSVPLIASALWAALPFGLTTSTSPLSHTTYIFFLVSGCYFLARICSDKERVIFSPFAAACFAFAYLTRHEGLVAMPYALFILAMLVIVRRDFRKIQVKNICIFVCTFLLCAFPYWLFLHGRLGYWTFTGKAAIVIQGGFDTREMLDSGKRGLTLWLEKNNGLGGGIRNSWSNFSQYFMAFFNSFPWWIHLLSWIGLPWFCTRSRRLYSACLALLLFVTLPVYLFNVTRSVSYVYSIFPFYLLTVAMGMERMASLARSGAAWFLRRSDGVLLETVRWLTAGILTACTVFVFTQNSLAEYRSTEAWEQNTLGWMFMDAGLFIKSISEPSDIVMTRWGLVSYYAERPMQVLPKGDIAEVVDAARKGGAAFLLIDTFSVVSRRQELAALLGPLSGVRVDPAIGLQLVWYRTFDVGGYLVYRVLPLMPRRGGGG